MEREPLPKIAFPGSLVAIIALFILLLAYNGNIGNIDSLSLSEGNRSLELIIGFILGAYLVIGVAITQATISIWSHFFGFGKIDYQKKLGVDQYKRHVVQQVFDTYVHGSDEQGRDFLSKNTLDYCRRRVDTYWLNLIIQVTCMFDILGGIIFLVPHHPKGWEAWVFLPTILLILFLLLWLAQANKKRASEELIFMQEKYLKKYKSSIRSELAKL